MPGKIQQGGRLLPGPSTPGGGADLGPLAAGQTVTVPRYPGGIDDVGTGKTLEFADDSSVLVALFTNFLGAIVQAIQTELGPLATNGLDENKWIAGSANLRDLLDQISLGTASGKGKLVGVKRWSKTKIGWGGQITVSADVGYRPAGSPNEVAVWAYLVQGQRTLVEVLTGPTSVRGRALFASSTSTSVNIVLSAAEVGNANPGLGGAPTNGAASYTVEGLVFFMPVGNPDR